MGAEGSLPLRVRAIRISQWGGPEVLELVEDAPEPTPNDDQVLGLSGADDLAAGCRSLVEGGVGCVVATRGAEGALIVDGDGSEEVPAFKVEVVDTTGCGDGFTAGLLAGLLAGAAPEDAAWLGLACGALVATGLGSDAGIENLGQVLSFLQRTQPAAAGRIKDSMKEHIS